MPKIDIPSAPTGEGSRYPEPYAAPCKKRRWVKLGDAAGLTQFGVNLVTLAPGVWSSQRHWHEKEDEFVYLLAGELVLVTDEGETVMRPGDCAGFKAGVRNGHCLQNRSDAPAQFLVVGGRDETDWGEYPDIDLRFLPGRYAGMGGYSRKDGTPY
ncbi:MAG: cupin domain-containing protein [Alphaproteobacteria bacterium]|nr:cupin domain-containing protein [Alphaproteobacteria bacterium]